jgi:serine/threonine-protein kinase
MLPIETPAPSTSDRKAPALAFGPFTFDRTRRLLRRGASELPLPPRVLGVLELLLARAGDIVARQDLIDSVWKDAFVTDTSLAEAVSFLRQALGDDPQAPTYIQTIHRRGYRFVAPVTERQPPRVEAVASSIESGTLKLECPPSVSPSLAGQLVPWSAALLCALFAAGAAWQLSVQQPVVPRVVRMTIDPVAGTSFDPRAPALALSPDGTAAAWSACDAVDCWLFIRALERLEATRVGGTDGAAAPVFSPDGRWIAFFAGGKLKKVAVAGGAPVPLADASEPLGAAWLEDGTIVFASSARSGLMRVSERGGDAAVLTIPATASGEVAHAWPAVMPDGDALIFTITTSPVPGAPGRIAVLDLSGGPATARWKTLVDAANLARPVSGDYVAYSRDSELHAVPVDRRRLITAGPDQAVVTALAPMQFTTSARGGLFYGTHPASTIQPSFVLVQDARVPVNGDAGRLRSAVLSPDGTRIAGVLGDQAGTDIWIADAERGASTRITHGGLNASPAWSRDGRTIFYASARGGAFEIWSRDAAAASPPSRVLASIGDRHLVPMSTSADGAVLYVESGGSTRGDLWMIPSGGGEPVPLVNSPFDEIAGVLSPDGTRLAFQSDESGRWEVSLLRLKDRQRLPLSTGGGYAPAWSADGKSVVYTTDRTLMRVDVDPAGAGASVPREVAMLPGAFTTGGVAPDGSILLVPARPASSTRAVLTLEWARELHQLLGPPAMVLPR